MDWYLGCAVDDLVVPSNKEMQDMFPSPNGWSQWELSPPEAFDSMSKYFVDQTDFAGNGLNFYGKSQNKLGMKLFEDQHDEHSIDSSFCQDFEGSVNQDTSSWDVSDYQLNDLDMTNQTDDVFLNSSHDISSDTFTGPFNFYYTEFENDDYGVLPNDNLYENMILESESDPSHLFAMGSSKYLKTHDFSPSVHEGARLYPLSPIKAQREEVSVSPGFEVMGEHINEEPTLDGSVLQELENAMTQMSDYTRICFRDALYRLAESSGKNSIDVVLERSAPSMVSDGNFRSENTKIMEAQTNAVDRAVANLMFYKMNSDTQNLSHGHSTSSGDAEVPVFSLKTEVKQDTA